MAENSSRFDDESSSRLSTANTREKSSKHVKKDLSKLNEHLAVMRKLTQSCNGKNRQSVEFFKEFSHRFLDYSKEQNDQVHNKLEPLEKLLDADVIDFNKFLDAIELDIEKLVEVFEATDGVRKDLHNARHSAAAHDLLIQTIRINAARKNNIINIINGLRAKTATPQAKISSKWHPTTGRPVESALCTYITRSTTHLITLQEMLYSRPFATKFIEKIIEQSAHVTDLIIKEFNPQQLDTYLEMLSTAKDTSVFSSTPQKTNTTSMGSFETDDNVTSTVEVSTKTATEPETKKEQQKTDISSRSPHGVSNK